MNPTVTIHSDVDGVARTITVTKTGADTGHITMTSAGAPENYDVNNVQADPAALKLACQTQILFISLDIALSIAKGTGGDPPVANAVIGGGTYAYPLRAGEDQAVQDFLNQAAFPPFGGAAVVA